MIENKILDSLRLTYKESNNTESLIDLLNSCISRDLSTKMAGEEMTETHSNNPDLFRDFYRLAREKNATKFLSFYDRSFTTIYAVKGNISKKNIQEYL